MAAVLDVPMSYFFETLPRPERGISAKLEFKAEARAEFVATDEGQRLVDAFVKMPKRLRPKVISFLTTFNSLEDELLQS